VARKHRYTEIASGLNYQDINGAWTPSKEQIVPVLTGGAAAIQGPHTVSFPYDLYIGAIEQTTPEGLHLRSRPICIAYASGTNSELIAELTNSIGQILPAGNAVIYTNCTTDLSCDLVATYRKFGFECDLVIRQKPPPPDVFGFDPDQTEVQLWTEFFDPPEPVQQLGPVTQNGLQDSTLQFGGTVMGRGSAFSAGGAPPAPRSALLTPHPQVFKSWVHIDGRTFLVERIPYPRIKNDLDGLASVEKPARWFAKSGTGSTTQPSTHPSIHPSSIQPSIRPTTQQSVRRTFQHSTTPTSKFASLRLPPARPVLSSGRPMQAAELDPASGPGLAADFVTLNTAATNFVCQGDTTYLMSGPFTCTSNLTLEAGTVIKASSNPTNSPVINVTGSLHCLGSPYRSAAFTSSDDNSLGEPVSGSSGSPSLMDNVVFLSCQNLAAPGQPWLLQQVRMSYALGGCFAYDDAPFSARHCQVVNCAYGLGSIYTNVTAENCLFAQCAWPTYAGGQLSAVNLTADGCTNFCYTYDVLARLALTNCIVVGTSQWVLSFSGSTNQPAPVLDHTAVLPNSAGLFTSAAGGFYYLCEASTNRNAGTTNISPTLLADLRQKTTYTPIVIPGGPLSRVDTTLAPQAQRDTDDIDIGYHYSPLDYAIGATCVTNPVTITVAPGTAIGCFATNGLGYGLAINNGAQLLCQGTATAPIHVAEYTAVQEQAGAGLHPIAYSLITDDVAETGSPPAAPANANCRFTEFSLMTHYAASLGFFATPCAARDCQFHGGEFASLASFALTNNLFERVLTYMSPGSNATCYVRNNLFYNGEFDLLLDVPASVTIRDNLFDRTSIYEDNSVSSPDAAYNAYLTNTDRLTPTNANDLIITNTDYIAGPLGSYYYPTIGGNLSRLINAGSTNADLVGLYHYSLITNMTGSIEIKETNSIVDIGFHWLAVNANGIPSDADADGVPDYIEDANGNGNVDSGETDWQSATDPGLKVIITRPRNGSNIP
jgi:hypothetical protein